MTETQVDKDSEALPPLAEQVSAQLGGWRGLVESGVPVAVFVLVNVGLGFVYTEDSRQALQWAIVAAVTVALGLAVMRLLRKRTVRYALNGLFGIALGAWLAWRSGEARDFFLPGIYINIAYGVGMLASIGLRHPLVGWFWSIIANGGKGDWRDDSRLARTFSWLTLVWAIVFLIKGAVQGALYLAHAETALAAARIAMGYPLIALLTAFTFWAVRRIRKPELAVG